MMFYSTYCTLQRVIITVQSTTSYIV